MAEPHPCTFLSAMLNLCSCMTFGIGQELKGAVFHCQICGVRLRTTSSIVPSHENMSAVRGLMSNVNLRVLVKVDLMHLCDGSTLHRNRISVESESSEVGATGWVLGSGWWKFSRLAHPMWVVEIGRRLTPVLHDVNPLIDIWNRFDRDW
jgi:hypothetical protein